MADELVDKVSPRGAYPIWKVLNSVVAVGSLGLGVFNFLNQPRVVSFDLKGTTDSFFQQLQKSPLSEAEKTQRVKRFEKALQQALVNYKQDNVIVLVKPAVVANVPDKTAEIRREIAARMKQGGNLVESE